MSGPELIAAFIAVLDAAAEIEYRNPRHTVAIRLERRGVVVRMTHVVHRRDPRPGEPLTYVRAAERDVGWAELQSEKAPKELLRETLKHVAAELDGGSPT